MSTVFEEYHLQNSLVLTLVLFSLIDFDILPFILKKEKYFFVLVLHFDIQLIFDFKNLSRLISQMAFLIFKMR